MIIVMQQGAAKKDLIEVLKKIRQLGYKTHIIHGVERDVIGAVGDERGKARLTSPTYSSTRSGALRGGRRGGAATPRRGDSEGMRPQEHPGAPEGR